MKYSTKVSLGLVALALLTNGVLLTLLYYEARESLMQQMRSTALSVASTTAALLDVDRYLEIRGRADEDSPAYHDVERYLRRARDANRRQDVRFKYHLHHRAETRRTRRRLISSWTPKRRGRTSHISGRPTNR